MQKHIPLITLGLLLIATTFGVFNKSESLGGQGGLSANSCAVSTVTMAGVGHQVSSTILSSSAARAWAQIELVTTTVGVATNTPSISFDEGAAATLASGVKLSTTTPIINFGLNTDFPYTGAVTAITDVGSTTIRVTDCIYN